MTFTVSERADDDLEGIFYISALAFGVAHADKYRIGLSRTFEFLASYPYAARLRSETVRPVRAYRYKAHIIIYKVQDDGTVLIVRVRHGREDWLSDPEGESD